MLPAQPPYIPYCGPAPVPGDLWGAWNLDPVLIALLLVGAVAAGFALRAEPARQRMALAGFAVLALAFPARGRGGVAVAALVHTVVTWVWHAPGPYAWALSSDMAYWVMEISLLASAVWLWRGLLDRRDGPAAPVAAAVATMAQMGLLGGLLLFAGAPLFLVHLSTTGPWGIGPLTDQQLAGIAMAVLGTPAYAGAALWQVLSLFKADQPATARA